MPKRDHYISWSKGGLEARPRILAALSLLIASVASAEEHMGNVTSWERVASGLEFKCGEQESVQIDFLTGGIFRVRWSRDGAFPACACLRSGAWSNPMTALPPVRIKVRSEDRGSG